MKRFAALIITALGLVSLIPVQSSAISGNYAALGDSVAAGAGLSTTTLCDRSSAAYPYTVAQTTGLSLSHYACTGAKADEGLYDSQERSGTSVPAQLNQAFQSGTPDLITITIGANDTRWTQFIRQCYYIRCGYSVDTGRFNTYLVDLKLELNVVMAKIHSLSDGDPPQVIVTGYYNPFSSTACDTTDRLTSTEISWLRARSSSLNTAIRGTVGKYSFAKYSPVSFSGHELCSSDSWIQGPTDLAPFHPTEAGQQAIAKAVLSKYRTPTNDPTGAKSYRERLLDFYERLRSDN
ncbi:MAG TPA: SGNH/GDSL hydrolase family protein [Candidatus Saccharimonadales bacterium]